MSADPQIRLFAAIYPPAEARRAMLEALRALDLPQHRETPEEQIHMTLHFIGNVRKKDLDETAESVERSCSGLSAFTLTPIRLITLPKGPRPRLVALETDSDSTMLELRSRLVRRLARHARAKPNDRFLPHFTLCRFKGAGRVRPVQHVVDLDPFEIKRVFLMRSVLLPQGAEHREVASFNLASRA